ncbi:MAG: hypothetical protein OXU64_09055 [Gemmatimonadota bacterium]|nr:hypothetical protein [Gemmatimonadota bacterium]
MKNVDFGFGLASAGPSRRRALAAAVVVLGASLACRESLTQVDSGVVASSLRPALKIAEPLPDLAELVAGLPPGRRTPLVATWKESWNRGVAAGRPLREEVYRAAGSPALEFDSAAAASAAGAVRRALAEARSFDRSLSPHLSRALEEAERLLGEAEEAGSGADWSDSAVKALMAADALRETSPRTVALSLVEAAEAVLGPLRGGGDEEPANRARARRLAWWGRLAVDAGGHELAIQRGYYACLLLGVELP